MIDRYCYNVPTGFVTFAGVSKMGICAQQGRWTVSLALQLQSPNLKPNDPRLEAMPRLILAYFSPFSQMGPRPGLKHSCWKSWCHGQSVMSFPLQPVLYCHPLTAAFCRQRRRGSPMRSNKQNWAASMVVFHFFLFFAMIMPTSARCVCVCLCWNFYFFAVREEIDNGIS